MKQKLLILFFALAANAGIAFAETYSGTCGENLTWTLTTEDGVLTISGKGSMNNYNPTSYSPSERSFAPWSSNGYSSYITKVVINDGATSIGRHAFYGCSNLTSVTIPNSLTSIENPAFDDCHITEILFTGTLEQWCTKSLGRSSISSSYRLYINNEEMIDVIIPESVTSISDGAFICCSNLTSVTIPNSVTSIGGFAFSNCTGLTSVTIGNSVKSIGNYAFSDCQIAEIRFMGTLEQWCKKSWGDLLYPTNAMYRLYINNEELTDVVIPESVKSIKDYTFYGCISLTSVTIHNSVKTIGGSAFCRCISLTSVTIGENVTTIGRSAFSDCSSLASVTLGKSVTSIGDEAFKDCGNITTLSLNASAIAGNAYSPYYNENILGFFPSSSIQNLIIGDAITVIGQYAFYGCGSLTSVTISNSVTSIGKEAFAGNKCSEIYFTGNLEQWINKQWNPTQITSEKYILYIEKQKTSNIVVPNSVTSIRDSTFYNCSSLTSVTIPNSVTSIGNDAFNNCSSLTKVVIGDGATSIGQEAFRGCTYLEEITIGSGINVENGFGQNTFYGCRYLLSVTCKAELPPVINSDVFEGCGVLSGIDLFVPEESVRRYRKAAVWSEFNIVGKDLGTDDPTNPTTDLFTITWQDEDGNILKTDNVENGTTPAYIGTTPTKEGYDFVGWLPNIKLATKDICYTTYFIPQTQAEEKVYTVNINGENCSLNINNQSPEGTVITIEAVADECFEFQQWSDGSKDNPRTVTVTKDMNITAEFNKLRYTVTGQTEAGAGGKVQIIKK